MENQLSGIDPKLLTKQAAAIKAVQNLEFKRGCRKIALSTATSIMGSHSLWSANRLDNNRPNVTAVLLEADKIYKWLIKH